MPKKSTTFDVAPEMPIPTRRQKRDTTEWAIDLMAVSATIFAILVSMDFGPLNLTDDNAVFVRNLMIGLSTLFWIAAIRLDISAKKNSEKQFELQMSNYETMRTKWVELASQRLEIEAKKN